MSGFELSFDYLKAYVYGNYSWAIPVYVMSKNNKSSLGWLEYPAWSVGVLEAYQIYILRGEDRYLYGLPF